MEQINYFNEGIGTLVFLISIPVFIALYCVISVAKDIALEKIKQLLN